MPCDTSAPIRDPKQLRIATEHNFEQLRVKVLAMASWW